jgi:hypothetical protein
MEAVNARDFEMTMAGFAKDVSDLRSVWPYVRQVLRLMVMERQFPTEGAGGQHGRFAPLSPRYAAWKRKKVGPKPILQLTGRLLGSFAEGHAEHVDRAGQTTLEWGSAVPYGLHHQTGYSKTMGGRKRKWAENARAIGEWRKSARASAKAFTAGGEEGSRNVPARRPLDPKGSDMDDLRRGIQKGIVAMARRRGFAISSAAYGPGERTGISGGEAFEIGRESMEGGA